MTICCMAARVMVGVTRVNNSALWTGEMGYMKAAAEHSCDRCSFPEIKICIPTVIVPAQFLVAGGGDSVAARDPMRCTMRMACWQIIMRAWFGLVLLVQNEV